jgi:glycosyltransferase involved in cell wall biosynthesis
MQATSEAGGAPPASLRISVVTAVYNARATIGDALDSVAAQTHPNVEHVVVDGGSTDGTLDQIARRRGRISAFVSEPDRGIYDALNKGMRMATGDVVGFLHADDVFADADALADVAAALADPSVDGVYADVVFVRPEAPDRVVRRYDSSRFSPDMLRRGWMPAHPTLYLRREVYARVGEYRTDYRIAGDFEMTIRLFAEARIRCRRLDRVLVRMRTGGASTRGFGATLRINREIMRACAEHGIPTSPLLLASRYAAKLRELLPRPRRS